jgi:hypothetical protein
VVPDSAYGSSGPSNDTCNWKFRCNLTNHCGTASISVPPPTPSSSTPHPHTSLTHPHLRIVLPPCPPPPPLPSIPHLVVPPSSLAAFCSPRSPAGRKVACQQRIPARLKGIHSLGTFGQVAPWANPVPTTLYPSATSIHSPSIND